MHFAIGDFSRSLYLSICVLIFRAFHLFYVFSDCQYARRRRERDIFFLMCIDDMHENAYFFAKSEFDCELFR